MSSPNKPIDPDSLSLSPSASASGGKPNLSNVQGHSDTTPSGGGGKPDFSNVQGHTDTVPGGSGGGGGGSQTYTVQKGDTLSNIAQHHYGKASKWHAIFEANRDQLDNPDLIQPGQVLKLPADA